MHREMTKVLTPAVELEVDWSQFVQNTFDLVVTPIHFESRILQLSIRTIPTANTMLYYVSSARHPGRLGKDGLGRVDEHEAFTT
jgi:hypothetical protein